MRQSRHIILSFMLSISTLFVVSQELPENTKQQLENLAEVTEEETENDEFLQLWNYLRKHPLNLNTAKPEDLQALPLITDLQIENFLLYKKLTGPLLSIYELQSVPAWDLDFIMKILPFVTLSDAATVQETLRRRFSEGENNILTRLSRTLEASKGYDKSLSNNYSGDRNHLLFRYRYQYKNLLQYGITADKDAGENFFKGNNKSGFDFYSFHLFVKNIGIIKTMAVGDYTVNLGQGLVQWQSLAFKKSAEVMNIKRQSSVIKPYSSSGEFYFNRGMAATIEKNRWQATLFGSLRNIDGSIDSNASGNDIFTSFISSGYHRTSTEIKHKNTVQQTSFGGNLRYQVFLFNVGFNAVYHRFSKSLLKQEQPYNLYALSGDAWCNESVDYSFTYKNIHFFGEVAVDKQFDKAVVNGALISVDPKVDVSLLHRSISKKYSAVYGNAFTENVQPNNENGFYLGLSLRPFPVFKLNSYADFYRFPWLKYRTDAPGSGKDFLVQLTYSPNKDFELYTRYRYENKKANEVATNDATNFLTEQPKQNWRLQFSYVLSPHTTIKSRAEMIWFDKEGKAFEDGFLVFAELHQKSIANFSGNLRLQYFETDGYNSRIYAFENDVLYSYSIPSFFDKGVRYYINLNYEATKKISVWLRWAQTIYQDKTSIGSGLDETNGCKKSELRLQLQIKL